MRLLIVVGLLAPLAGCGWFSGPEPSATASAFLTAVVRGDAAAAAHLTDDPTAASELIQQVDNALEPESVQMRLESIQQSPESDEIATAVFTAVWQLKNQRQWRYEGKFDLVRTEQAWVVRWRPSVLHPELRAQQTITLREEVPVPAPVLERDGIPLLSAETVVNVVVDPAQAPTVAAQLAGALSQFDDRITEQSILQEAAATPAGQGYFVAVLREIDYQSVRNQIYELPGVRFPTQTRLLGPDRDFASQLLPGIRAEVEEQLAGAAGWSIVTVDAFGAEVQTLAGKPADPAPTVATTLSRAMQAAGEDAVEGVPNPAMIVALQPSSGDVLAVAQNGPADAQGALSLTGRYPPGSTFKIVTAAAALQRGVTPQTPVQCPATTNIGGRVVPNIDLFGLGTVPLRTAFARSCNTTFAQLAAGFEPGALPDTARQLGIGMDFDITGLVTLTGVVPPAEDVVQRAANGFGQGRVLVTPFGMALATATVATGGQVPTPALIQGTRTRVTGAPRAPLAPEVAGALQEMMREVVTEGSATALQGQGDIRGKTGTAEYSSTGSHGWFVGFRGDLAFAVLVVDAGSSGPAVETAGRFLAALGPG
ncbi:MAG: penicillin-binding transpeptidase domain-containing protein [Actinomycetota bacterium]|nr:penicillin-binding transpeptidase domain-containing protein [Actinomycetota bacterium]